MSKILELLFPPRCPGCDEILRQYEREAGFCKKCYRKLHFIGDHGCITCGSFVADPTREYCYDCKKRSHNFNQARSVFLYAEPMKKAMYRFKYSNRRSYARVFADYIMKYFGQWINRKQIDVIIPVPMYYKKQRVRGYNQAQVLANELAKRTHIPMVTDYVIRDKNTIPMKKLDDTARRLNLENAFKIRKSSVLFKKVLLVDDIYTTGATVDVISKQLKLAGVKEIYCITVCSPEGRQTKG